MAFTLPSDIFAQYQEIVDELINNDFVGESCQLTYPELKSDCPNCILNSATGKSSNKYQQGGPIPFTVGICPYCRGAGVFSTPQVEVIRLRVYWTNKDFRKLGFVDVPNGNIMVIGFMSDAAKMKRCTDVMVLNDMSNVFNLKYVLSGEVLPWGFGHNKYFVAQLARKA